MKAVFTLVAGPEELLNCLLDEKTRMLWESENIRSVTKSADDSITLVFFNGYSETYKYSYGIEKESGNTYIKEEVQGSGARYFII